MIVHKVIKTDKGRVTVQKNEFGVIELKVRRNNHTEKLTLPYQNLEDVEKIVEMLLDSKHIKGNKED
ncbi:hypothetical protein [Bacillus infantis]|uniref:hypothetical protein n=1 Tax=Bacillus infantis TaxID=324767 RepID=UPI00209D43E1|nr:hypothetical protein [Bacillus infantis]MCP1159346.1 hypothetical protein [Bacillus infantis]